MSETQSAHQSANGRFVPGNCANPRGRVSRAEQRAQVAATIEQLSAEFGGLDALSATERLMVMKAAELVVLGRPRSPEDQVRHANSIARMLSIVRRGKRRPVASVPSLAECREMVRAK